MKKIVDLGYARQYGIDHTNNEFISFIDADDFYALYANNNTEEEAGN